MAAALLCMKRELLYYLRQLHAKQIFHQTESDLSMKKQLLTTAQFQDSLIRYIGTSKPDPLARAQLEKLALSWEQDDSEQMICCGTLSISSEYVCVTILVMCNCKIDTTNNTAGGAADFQNEFHFQLTASAKLLPVSTAGEEGEQPKKKRKGLGLLVEAKSRTTRGHPPGRWPPERKMLTQEERRERRCGSHMFALPVSCWHGIHASHPLTHEAI